MRPGASACRSATSATSSPTCRARSGLVRSTSAPSHARANSGSAQSSLFFCAVAEGDGVVLSRPPAPASGDSAVGAPAAPAIGLGVGDGGLVALGPSGSTTTPS